ncbi:MAG: tandem-95 repeat protein, partial [Verrucomicrobia bacterium]|nr:tandem-95 repeat protein [Verrucomicrobiota bacterium]
MFLWGANNEGQRNVPSGVSGVTAIASGAWDHNLAVRGNGTVAAWQRNDAGQSNVPAGLTGVVGVAAGFQHSVALKNDGTLVAWGTNSSGQLSIPAGLSGVTRVLAGGDFTIALTGSLTSYAATAAQTLNSAVTNITPGPANESSQAVSFTVTNNNSALFTVQPAISSTGVLTFTAGSTTGSATVTVVMQDDGGTANGGINSTASQTFVITTTNAAPTDLALSTAILAENNAPGAIVGTLTATDADAGQTQTFSLVSGTGSTDNSAFTIQGSSLRLTPSANFEAKSSYSLRVQTSDGAGGTFAKALTVTILNVNEAPADITLSASSLAENNAANATIGTLAAIGDPEAGQTHSFSLATGEGDTDNASFTLSGTSLRLTPSADFETKASYAIRLRATDNGAPAASFEKQFTIAITNVNEAPTNITLTPATLAENNAPGATVGTLTAADVDAGSTHTFSFVAGTGSDDNAAFTLSGSSLKLTPSANFETKSLYSLRVQANDGAGGTFAKALTVTITDVNEAPTDIALSVATLAENNAANATVGTLSALGDPDAGATHSFSLVTGTGSGDNASFTLTGSTLKLTPSADFETKSSYSLRVQANDGAGGLFAKALTVTITDANDAPTNIALSASSLAENNAANATVGTLSATDVDAGATHTFTLVSGIGSDDNASFTIAGNSLQLTPSADFETKSSYALRIQAYDGAGGTFAQALTVTITDANEAPTNIILSTNSLAENNAANAAVGTLSAVDQDLLQTHGFSLVAGTGSTDNAAFTIAGNVLQLNAAADFETKSSYAIRLRATDDGSPVRNFEKAFTITINDVNEVPTLAAISKNGTEDTTVTFFAADFTAAYSDAENTALASITVTALPAAGSLKLSGSNVTAAQVIPAANLGSLTYVPAADENGARTFTVTASDGNASSTPATLVTMTLTAVNDAPSFATGAGAASPAGDTWTLQSAYPASLTPALAYSPDGSRLLAGQWNGFIQVSNDQGATWTARNTVAERSYQGGFAFSADNSRMYAAPRYSPMLTSTDGGTTWTALPLTPGNNGYWTGVACSTNGQVVIGGNADFGYLYTSTDSGATWATHLTDGLRGWGGVAASADGTVLAAASYAVNSGSNPDRIYISTNSGQSWTPRGPTAFWVGVACSSDGTKLVATADNGQIHTSTDSGLTWTARESTRNWGRVVSSADGNTLLTTASGVIYRTIDAGVTWVPNSSRNWGTVTMTSDGSKFAATIAGLSQQVYTSSGTTAPYAVTVL